MISFDDLKSRLHGVKGSGDATTAKCPAHEDGSASLSVTKTATKILLKCHAGCAFNDIVAALGLKPGDFFPEKARKKLTLDEFAATKKLPKSYLSERGLFDLVDGGVAIVYKDENANPIATKKRLHIIAKKGSVWPKGHKLAAYGLDRLSRARESQRLILVEGETDQLTLDHAGFPALGIPGASSAKATLERRYVENITTIYVSHEPDEGGDKFVAGVCERLRGLAWRGELRELRLSGAKDPSELWIADSQAFPTVFQAALEAANPIDYRKAPESPKHDRPEYEVRADGIWKLRSEDDGGDFKLINCIPAIVEDVAIDDGTGEIRRRYIMTAKLEHGELVGPFSIPADQFSSLNWIAQHIGSIAVIRPFSAVREHLRVAIQTTSSPARRKVYAHTGWREIDGELAYLFHGGAVGAEGVAVELPSPLDCYALPPAVEDLKDTVRASLALFDLVPAIASALLGAVYLAPLASYLPPDFTVWLFGASGLFKTELAALALNHYGAGFSRTRMPLDMLATANAAEQKMCVAKDALIVFDDYCPKSNLRERQEQERTAERIIRASGNRSARARLRSDLSSVPDRPPRGLLLVTAEDLPPGGVSSVGRTLTVEIKRGDVSAAALTAAQKQRPLYSHAMRGYLEWLRPQLVEDLPKHLQNAFEDAREHFSGGGTHSRHSSQVAMMYVALDLFLRFATEAGALSEDDAHERLATATEHLGRYGEVAREAQLLADPAQRFIQAVRTVLNTGQARLVSTASPLNDDNEERKIKLPSAIGWHGGDFVYLDPMATQQAVARFMTSSGDSWATSSRALGAALLRSNLVIPSRDGRPQSLVTLGGSKERVFKIPATAFDVEPDQVPEEPDQGAASKKRYHGFSDGAEPLEPQEPLPQGRGG